ncbi:unnamed protein product [marine sediment metagenome]|uniref:Uncharacterized protein n=1 Tax=marine sediment metagenome TaxID=412755 RepID=X0ZYC9_9ZZZZ
MSILRPIVLNMKLTDTTNINRQTSKLANFMMPVNICPLFLYKYRRRIKTKAGGIAI